VVVVVVVVVVVEPIVSFIYIIVVVTFSAHPISPRRNAHFVSKLHSLSSGMAMPQACC
jgi:hypothetical protein